MLVFKALSEWGQTATPHGRRAVGILLFQDVAIVPLMLLVPLLTDTGEPPTLAAYFTLAVNSLLFMVAVGLGRRIIARWVVPTLARLRSVELVVLFALSVLGGVCWFAAQLGLPPAIGALASGIMLSGNRLSKQIDMIVLPFRETFAAVFFVTLGTLFSPTTFFEEPLLLSIGLVAMVLLKTGAAAVALWLIGLRWPAALGMGLGLAQLGEFSFLVLAEGVGQGIISRDDYGRLLFIAMGTLLVSPQLMKLGLRWTDDRVEQQTDPHRAAIADTPIQHALIIGMGPIGRQLASRLELMGIDACLLDLSPINLQAFAQLGFSTVAGDARDPEVLRRARVDECRLAVISVPDDEIANRIVRAVRELNPAAAILVRCRFQGSIQTAKRAGANVVVSEEAEASGKLLAQCEEVVRAAAKGASGGA